MKVSQIKLGATINLGEYSDIRPEVTVELGAKDKAEDARELALSEINKVWSQTSNKQFSERVSTSPVSAVAMQKMKCYATGAEVDFEPTSHKYYYNGELLVSGSGFASQFEHEFNKAMIIPKSAAKLGVAEEVVDEYWTSKGNCSTTFGTALHQALEHYGKYYQLSQEDIDSKTGEPKGLGIHPTLAPIVELFFEGRENERAVYEPFVADIKNMRCGQVDRLLITGNKKCRIQDFKTNGDLYKQNTPKTLKSPYAFLPNQPVGSYTLQLSFYKAILEAAGWIVEGLDLFHWDGEAWNEVELKPVSLDTPKEDINLGAMV